MPIQLEECARKNYQFHVVGIASRLLCGLRDWRSSGAFIRHSDRPLGNELRENERRMSNDKMQCKFGSHFFSLVGSVMMLLDVMDSSECGWM